MVIFSNDEITLRTVENECSHLPEERKNSSEVCACGRTVCCGKHKGCCHKKKEKIRFINEKNR